MKLLISKKLAASEDMRFFSNLYEQYKHFMYYIAQQYTKSEEDCNDIVQDALVRLLRNSETLQTLNDPQIRSYIAVTIKSVYLDDRYHKRKLSFIPLEDDAVQSRFATDPSFFSSLPDVSSKLEIERLMQSLPERDWMVLEGKYILGYSQEELSKIIHVAPDSIRTILVRARQKAREILLSGDRASEVKK